MKTRAVAVAFLVASAIQAQEREEPSPPALRLRDLRLDSPPATILVGISPASVERPNTPRALIASLISATGTSGIVPNGFAMETTPFWLASHPMLTLDDYFHPSFGDRLRYFSAVSVATARPKSRNDSVASDAHVSIAVRTLLASGHASPALVRASEALRKAQLQYLTAYAQWDAVRAQASSLAAARRRLARQEDMLSTLVTRVLVGEQRALKDSTMRTLARRDSARAQVALAEAADADVARLEKEMDALDEKLSRFAKTFAEEDLEPDGFILELAAGTRARFIEGQWSHERVDGMGLWLTPMYRMSAKHLEVIGVLRYLTRVADYDNRNLIDAGARLSRGIGRASVGAEVTNRWLTAKGKGSTRWAAIFSVPLPSDLQIIGSFGSDFRRADGKRPLIATLGINLGVGAIMLAPASRSASL
jgi:hypothetical protein